MFRYLKGLFLMARPLFLLGTAPIYLLGAAAAWSDTQSLQPAMLVLGILEVWLIQLLTHYSNEYRDMETDLATEVPTRVSGGSRVLVKGLVPRKAARVAAVTSLSAAVVLAVVLAMSGAGPWTLPIAGVAMTLGWSYSNPPLRLHSRGLGEATVAVASGLLAPVWSYYLQTSAVSPRLLMACIAIALFAFALAVATAQPDISADQATGKATLSVRLGAARSTRLLEAALVAGWLIYVVASVRIWPVWGGVGAAASLPLLLAWTWIARGRHSRSAASLERLGLTIGLLVGYAALSLATGFIFS